MAMMWRAVKGSLGEGWVVILWRAEPRLCRWSSLMEMGCVPCRRKCFISIALVLSLTTGTDLPEAFFYCHIQQGCCSCNCLAGVCDFLHVIQPGTSVLAFCGLVLCWTRADIELCQVLISAESELKQHP